MHPQSVPGPVVWQLSDVQPLNTRPLCCFMLELARALDLFTGLGCVSNNLHFTFVYLVCVHTFTHMFLHSICVEVRGQLSD